jgi:hypothetical protein
MVFPDMAELIRKTVPVLEMGVYLFMMAKNTVNAFALGWGVFLPPGDN